MQKSLIWSELSDQSKRIFSIVASILMFITVFHVMVGDAQAAETNVELLKKETLDHDHLRLTTSNIAASMPSAVSVAGVTHFAWASAVKSGSVLDYKASLDGGNAFTADRAVSDVFFSILDICIAASDDGLNVAIVAEVYSDDNSATEICMVISEDGGISWSNAIFIGKGYGVTASYRGTKLVVGFTSDGEDASYCALVVARDERSLNGSWLFKAPLGKGVGAIACDADSVYFTFLPASNPGAVAYGRLAIDGKVLTDIQAAYNGGGSILDSDLVVIDSIPYIILSTSKWSTSSLLLITPAGVGDKWYQSVIEDFKVNITQIGAAAHDGKLIIAYRSALDISTIGIIECDLAGGLLSNSEAISTDGAESSCPDVIAESGVVSCIWQEEHGKGSELVLFTDALMEKPDLASVKNALVSDSVGSMLAFDSELKSSVSKDLDSLDELIASSDENAAVTLIDKILSRVKTEGMLPSTTDPKMIAKATKDLETVVTVLEARRASLLNPNVVEQPVIDLSQAYIYDLKVRVLSPTHSSIAWRTSVGTENDEVTLFADGLDDAMTITQANQGSYHCIDIATEPNTTCAFTVRSWLKDDFLEASGSFSSGLIMENLTVDSNDTSCTLSWTTPIECNSTLTYALQGEDQALSPVNSTWGMLHTATLSNLTIGGQYEIAVTIASERFPRASCSITSSFIMPSTEEYEESGFAEGADHAVKILSIPMQFSASPPYVSITNVASSIIGAHSARVTWTTNVIATSVVEYGLTTSYGLSKTGANSTAHTVDLVGLDAFSLYHFRVRSMEIADPTDSAVSSDTIFRVVYNDDNRGSDAGNTFATAMRTASGLHGGWLDGGSDSADYYSINLAVGQLLSARLIVPTVPSGYNYNLCIYNPSNVLKAWSNGSGSAAESASFTANVAGLWEVAVTRVTAPGQGIYLLWTNVTGGFDSYDLDVGGTGDNDATGRLPGMAILDGTGWSAASGGKRDAVANSAFVLNLNPSSYQASTDYLMTIRYISTAGTSVQIQSGGSWATVYSLSSSTSWTSRSFLISSSLLTDGIPDTQAGMNVKLRFTAAAQVDSISAIAYGYSSGVTFTSSEHVPGAILETGWTVNSQGVANATSGATLLVALPRSDLTYVVQFVYLSSTQGQDVQQQTASSTWKSLGLLSRWGQGASVQLDPTYYDVDSASPGYSIRLKLMSPLCNLSGIRVTPSLITTDVGVTGDNLSASHIYGVNVLPNTEWSSTTTVDGRTVRYTTNNMANFYLDGAWSTKTYEITMTYKTSSAGYVRQWGGSSYYNLVTLVADGQWHDAIFKTRSDIMFDYETAGFINMLFEITSTTCYVDKITVSIDTDGDGYSDSSELPRLYNYDTTVYNGDMSKQFTVPVSGPITTSFRIALLGYREYDGGWIYYPSYGYVYIDGALIWSGSSSGWTTYTVFTPSIVSTLASGTHTFSVDIGGSGNTGDTRNIKFESSYTLNPFSNDTDGDGILDGAEFTAGTNPCNADSDNDGLADGSELYSQVWTTDNFYTIPDGGGATNRVVIKLTLPALSAPLTAVWLQIGILHAVDAQLKVKVQRGTGTITTLYNQVAGVNLFKSWNLLTQGYTLADFTTSATWTIYVEDYVVNTFGTVQYCKLQADGKTDALDSDSDNDGILDGEEVHLGVDGWCTNPRSTDTDGDGVTDPNEVNGATPCSSATDPTRNDTDDDGYLDNVDRYMGDLVVRLTIQEYKTLELINGGNTRDIFFIIYTPMGDYATKRKTGAVLNTLYALNWVYDFDVPDTATTAHFDMEAVADNAGTLGDDILLDGAPGGDQSLSADYTLSTSILNMTSQGVQDWPLDFDSECYMKIKLEKAVKARANLIIINGSSDSGGYGLDKISTNNYRYSADQEVYIINLNILSGSGRFVTGLNTIILPRAIAMECKLNYSLEHINLMPANHPLKDATFVYTNTSQAISSAHVVVVISKNLSAAQAETLIYDLTHNSTNGRIGNNVSISTTNIYLLHLPSDVLAGIPMNISNAGLGPGPSYLSLWGGIVSILNFILEAVFFVLTFGIVLTFYLFDLGMKVLGAIANATANAIKAAVDTLVSAFMEFAKWALKFIQDAFTALIAAPLQGLYNGLMSWAMGLVTLISTAAKGIENGASNLAASVPIVQYIVNSDIFKILLAIGIALFTIVLVASLLGPFGFLTTLLVPMLVNLLISGMISAVFVIALETNFIGWISDTICDILGDDLTEGMAGIMGATMGTIGWLASLITSPLVADFKGFILSSIGAILSWASNLYTDWTSKMTLNMIGLGIAAYGFVDLFIRHNSPLLKLNPEGTSIMKGMSIMETGICIFELTTTVASQ